jgi:hypothetical protein
MPSAPDGFDGNPVVETAWLNVALFTGSHANRAAVEVALRLWRHGAALTDRERQAVIRRFPAPTVPPVPSDVDGQSIGGRS